VGAAIVYAGAAPGEVAGLLQINARVPSGLPAPSAATLVLNIGGASSQTGSTVHLQ
jgi:uncharacterized protein (TIGR03437 family)